MNRQEILEALKNDNYYRNLSDKDFFDANNLDNLAKYLEHNFAKTDESKKVILDMLSHKKHNPSDLYNYRITQEELFNLNKKYYDNTYLYHGLNAYTTNLTDKSLDISEKIENNLHNIINNKDIELATSSTHMIGDIGIKGKGDSLFAQPWDMYSVVDKETGQRSKPRAGAIITEDDIFGIIEKYHKNPKKIKPWEKHDEVIAKNFEIESLWVKEDFYNNNQDFVLKLLKDNKIQNLDIVHSNSFEQYHNVDIERINVNNINLEDKKITPQEAFDKYGPNDDRFYTSQGLDPKEQKEAINKLNSKRKPPEPLPDYSADNARLDKMLAEDKAYIESLEKQRKRPNYKPVKGPKLKEITKKDNNLDKLYQDKIDWINQYHPDLVESNEAKVKLYDYINDKSKKISFDDIIRANASAHVNDTVYHGMANPFYKLSEKESFELINKGDIAVADSSLFNIINNKNIEISVSNKPVYSNIGIKGKADILAYFTSDVGSYVQDNGKRVVKGNSLLNRFIHKREQKGNYHEGFARNFSIESLWVKENFYNKNKKEIIELLKKYDIKKIDIIDKNDKVKQTFNFNDIESNVKIDDSLDNLKNESIKKKKYKPVRGPKLKETVKQDRNLEKATNEVFDNFTENIDNTQKPKIKNTPKPSKNIVKPTKNTSKMTTKSLGGAGKGAIGLIVAGVTGLVVGKALSSDNDNKDKKQDKQVAKQQNISYNNQYIDNQYTMQMAQDISSYRYGKHMTGFVNY